MLLLCRTIHLLLEQNESAILKFNNSLDFWVAMLKKILFVLNMVVDLGCNFHEIILNRFNVINSKSWWSWWEKSIHMKIYNSVDLWAVVLKKILNVLNIEVNYCVNFHKNTIKIFWEINCVSILLGKKMSAFYKLNNSITLLLRHLKKFTTILDIDANKQLKFHKNPTDSLRVKKSEKNGHLRLTHLKRGTKASSPTQWMAFSACSSTHTAANEHPCAGGRKKAAVSPCLPVIGSIIERWVRSRRQIKDRWLVAARGGGSSITSLIARGQ